MERTKGEKDKASFKTFNSSMSKNAVKNIQLLKHEISVSENLISKELCMTNALQEQMKQPINVHRWRVLECTHPKSYELVQKSNVLTKRLVERNSLLTKQAEDLTLKQEMYCQIRMAVKKAPGLETPEMVRYYTHLLAAKREQLRTLKNELKEAEWQRDYYKHEINGIQKRYLCLKHAYFKRMRNKMEMKRTSCFEGNQIQETQQEQEQEQEPAQKDDEIGGEDYDLGITNPSSTYQLNPLGSFINEHNE